jgi:hypothetical protein
MSTDFRGGSMLGSVTRLFLLAVLALHTTQGLAGQGPTGASAQPRSKESHGDLWESEPSKMGVFFRTEPNAAKLIGNKVLGNNFSLTVGIEHWEQNQRQTHRRQIWRFSCSQNVTEPKGPPVTCSVRRTVILEAQLGLLPFAAEHYHSTEDETLRIVHFDWQRGIAELSIVHQNGRTAEVTIQFSEKDGYYFLKGFSAATLLRESPSGKVAIIEYRVPEYTYHVNMPIEMPGLNDAGLRAWDELFATLPKADQEAWFAMFAEKKLAAIDAINEKDLSAVVLTELKRRYPDLTVDEKNVNNTSFTAEQEKTLTQLVEDQFLEALVSDVRSNVRISNAGRNVIVEYLKKVKLSR